MIYSHTKHRYKAYSMLRQTKVKPEDADKSDKEQQKCQGKVSRTQREKERSREQPDHTMIPVNYSLTKLDLSHKEKLHPAIMNK